MDARRLRDAGQVVGRVLTRVAPYAAGVALRQVADEPAKAALGAVRVLPPAARRALVGRRRAELSALGLAESGRRADALRRLSAAGEDPRLAAATRRRLVALALALEDAPAAARLLAPLPPDDPARGRLEARLASVEGELTRALDLVPRATRRDRALARRLAGELAAVQPAAAAHRPPPAPPVPAPRPGAVLHLVTASLPHRATGYAVRTAEITRAQRALGLDPTVATALGFPVLQGVLGAAPVDVVDATPYVRLLPRAAPATRDAALRTAVELAHAVVQQVRPAVLHAASAHPNGQVALGLRERTGLPVVYEVRGFLEETWLSRSGDARLGAERHRLSRAAETWVMQQADAVVTLSEGMRVEVVSRGIPPERVAVVPNGVDERFLAPLPDPAPVRTRLGAAPGDVVVGAVTSVTAYEGLDVLARAVRLLRDRGTPVRLLVVGDGEALPALQQLVAELGLGDDALLPGRVPFADVRAYLAALDVVAVPRRDVRVARLVTPLKPLEALASGRPVVASDLPALAEVVAPGRGVLVPPDDPAALADALHRLVDDPAERARLGAAGREWVARERRWAQLVPRYLEVYARIGAAVPGRA